MKYNTWAFHKINCKLKNKFSQYRNKNANRMIEIVWSVNIMVATLIFGVAWVLYYILLMIKNIILSFKVAEKDLNNFLKKQNN